MHKTLPAALCALSIALALATPAAALSQEDLPLDLRDHWSAPYVITLLEAGTVTGYPDGRFRPNLTLTREEAVSLLYHLLPASALPDESVWAGVPLYPDVAGRWSQDMIHALLALGVLDREDSFRPADPMTRGDMARYTAKVLILLDTLHAQTSPGTAPETPVDPAAPANPVEPAGPAGETPEPPLDDAGTPEPDPETPAKSSPPGDQTVPAVPQEPSPQDTGEAAGSTVNSADMTPPGSGAEQTPDISAGEPQTPPETAPDGETGIPYGGDGPSEPHTAPGGAAGQSGVTIPAPEKITIDQVRQELAGGAPLAFPDSAVADQGLYIQFLYYRGVITGSNTGSYQPQDTLNRGQAAALLFRASGLPLSATAFDPLPAYRMIDVPYISQIYPVNAPVGCEATSLLMGLKAKGYAQDVDLRTFLDNLPRSSSDPAKGFVGSPYVADPTKRTRTTIYPAKLTEYGCRYGNVIDLTGASLAEIQREVLSGNPVVVYMTLYWQTPFYRWYTVEGERQRLLSNNHALLLCGYDANTNAYYVADPYNIKNRYQEYDYWVDGATFEPIYLERCHAVAVE